LLATPEFAALLRDRFVFVRCHVGPGGHASPPGVEFPGDLDAVPFFALMDSNGRIVATQATSEFEFLWFYWKPKVRRFLTRWASLSAR
jgi:hypothetical protein